MYMHPRLSFVGLNNGRTDTDLIKFSLNCQFKVD